MSHFYLSLFIVLLSCASLNAQSANDSPENALNAVFKKGNLMAALSGHEWRPGLNLAAASLAVGQTISLNVSLREGVAYVFLASGASEQTDADLYLRDPSGRILAEDQQKDGTPVVEFTAPADGTFQLQLHLAAAEHPEEYLALCLLRRGGRQVSEQQYLGISSGFFQAAKGITSTIAGANWQKNTGVWCLLGYSLTNNDGVSLRGLRPAFGNTIFAAAGPEASEISLYLASDEGRIVAGISRPEAFPLLRYDCPPGTLLDLRVEIESIKVPSLVLVGVFHH